MQTINTTMRNDAGPIQKRGTGAKDGQNSGRLLAKYKNAIPDHGLTRTSYQDTEHLGSIIKRQEQALSPKSATRSK